MTLNDLPKIKLDISERLDLFKEGPGNTDKIPFYKNGWKNVKSMWDFRWESENRNEYCKSLIWLRKPIQICKMVKSFKAESDYASTREVLDTLKEYSEQYEVNYSLQKHSRNGYYDHTTLDIYIMKKETPDEFKIRKKWQENYINKILDTRKKEVEEKKKREKKKEIQQLKILKEKYEK